MAAMALRVDPRSSSGVIPDRRGSTLTPEHHAKLVAGMAAHREKIREASLRGGETMRARWGAAGPTHRERNAARHEQAVVRKAATAARWAERRAEQQRRTAFREWFKSDEGFASVYLLALEPGWLEQEFPAWRAEIDA